MRSQDCDDSCSNSTLLSGILVCLPASARTRDRGVSANRSRAAWWPIDESFFQRRFITAAIERYQLRLLVYEVQQEAIAKWL